MHPSFNYISADYLADYFQPTADDPTVFQPRYHGKLRTVLDLPELVTRESLLRVANFLHPATRETLRSRKGTNVAFGYVLPGGKSTSLVAMADVRLIDHFALTHAKFLEETIEPLIEINEAASCRSPEPTGEMLAISRNEMFNRDGELFLHMDLAIIALTRNPSDVRWRAASIARIDSEIVLLRQAFNTLWARERAKLGYVDLVRHADGQCVSLDCAEIPPAMRRRQCNRSDAICTRAANDVSVRRTEVFMTEAQAQEAAARRRHEIASEWARPSKHTRTEFTQRFWNQLLSVDRAVLDRLRSAAPTRAVSFLAPTEVDEHEVAKAALIAAAEKIVNEERFNATQGKQVPWALTTSQLLLRAFHCASGLPSLEALRTVLRLSSEVACPHLRQLPGGLWATPRGQAWLDTLVQLLSLRPYTPGPSAIIRAEQPVGYFSGFVGLRINHLDVKSAKTPLQHVPWETLIRASRAEPGQLVVWGQNRWIRTQGLTGTHPELNASDEWSPRAAQDSGPAKPAKSNPLVLVALGDPNLFIHPFLRRLSEFSQDTRIILTEKQGEVEAHRFDAVPSLLEYLAEHHALVLKTTARTKTADRNVHHRLYAAQVTAPPGTIVNQLIDAGRVIFRSEASPRDTQLARVVAARRAGRTSTVLVASQAEADHCNAQIHAALLPDHTIEFATLRSATPHLEAAFARGRLPSAAYPLAVKAANRLPTGLPCGSVFILREVTGQRLVATDKHSRLTLLVTDDVWPKLVPLERRTLRLGVGTWVTPTLFARCTAANGMALVPGYPYRIVECTAAEIRFEKGQVLRAADYPAGLQLDLAYAIPLPASERQWPKLKLFELFLAVPPEVIAQRGGWRFYRECESHSSVGAILDTPDLFTLKQMLGLERPDPHLSLTPAAVIAPPTPPRPLPAGQSQPRPVLDRAVEALRPSL